MAGAKAKRNVSILILMCASVWILKPYIGGNVKHPNNKINSFHADKKSHQYFANTDAHYRSDSDPTKNNEKELEYFLNKYADSNKRILLVYFEISYMDLAVNFYYLSIDRLNITNYLLFTTSEDSCTKFKSIVGSPDAHCGFINKHVPYTRRSQTIQKSNLVFHALSLGYTAMLADIDIVFFQNPLPANFELLDSYDMAFQMDRSHPSVYNSGFYAVKPSELILSLFEEWVSKAAKNKTTTEQRVLNAILPGFLETHGDLKIKELSKTAYMGGCGYWKDEKNISSKHDPFSRNKSQNNNRMIVHNNCAGGPRKKIYLFRESLLWRYDYDGYYSDSSRKYLMYNNIITKHDNLKQLELAALQCALSIAFILKRVLILPVFHCYKDNSNIYDECSILQFNFTGFDAYFKYREHSFLHNPLTSPHIKESISSPLVIASQTNIDGLEQTGLHSSLKEARYVNPDDTKHGASLYEIRTWFGKETESVLYFPSLYDTFIGFKNDDEQQFVDIKMAFDKLSGPDADFWEGKKWD